MLSFLKNHPFAVEAFFRRSVVLTFAVPREQLEHLIPECLEPDTFQDRWAFLAVAMVQTEGLRPKGFPPFLGRNFFLMGYRIFVRYTTSQGKNLRGLYILRSETDRVLMKIMGNIFTHYHYVATDIRRETDGPITRFYSDDSGFDVAVERLGPEAALPTGSPFRDWKEARRFAGPLPHTFTYDARTKTVLIIRGIRENWTPVPVGVMRWHFDYLDRLGLKNPVLAAAFEVENIPYHWEKGIIDPWNPHANRSRVF